MTDQEKRDLLVRLAEGVMGWKVTVRPDAILFDRRPSFPQWELALDGKPRGRQWNPLESIADAWMLLEALRNRNVNLVLTSSSSCPQVGAFLIDGIWAIGRHVNMIPDHGDPAMIGQAFAETAPLAICRAADAVLKAGGSR